MVQSTEHINEFDVDSFIEDDGSGYYDLSNHVPDKKEIIGLLDEKKTCPECGPRCTDEDIYYGNSETICKICGTVIDEKRPEQNNGWRIFEAGDMSKVHAEKQKVGRPMTTIIPYSFTDYAGGKLSSEMRNKMSRLKKRDDKVKRTNDDRVLGEAVNQIRIMSSKLKLPDAMRDNAILFFKKFVKKEMEGNLKGKCIINLSTAVVYKVCKDMRSPYTIKEISRLSKIDAGEIRKNYSTIMQHTRKKKRKIQSPIDFIPRIATQVKVDGTVESHAMKMMRDAMDCPGYKKKSVGKEAVGFSAGAVYLSCIIHGVIPMRTRDNISSLTEVADTTIKKRAEDIIELLGIGKQIRESFEEHYEKYLERYKNRFKSE